MEWIGHADINADLSKMVYYITCSMGLLVDCETMKIK